MKNKLICLVGKSGSGKTTLTKSLEKDGFNIIHSFTTRKKRHEHEWGHIFVNDCDCLNAEGKPKENVIAHTFYNNNHYWATREQIKGATIYVVDPIGAFELKKIIKDIPVVTIYLQCDDDILLDRMQARFDNIDSIKQRLAYDKENFMNFENHSDFVINANVDIEGVNNAFSDIINKL